MKILLDRPRCEGHGLCKQAAPDLLHLDDDAEPVLDHDELADDEVAAANGAVRACPVAALRLE